jgi:hypothetical protein
MAGWSPQGQVWLGFSRVYDLSSEMHAVGSCSMTHQRNARSRLVLITPPAKCTQSDMLIPDERNARRR